MTLHPTAARFQESLAEGGLEVEVRMLPDSARTAAEAAAAIGVEVGRIVKSLVFTDGEGPVMVLSAGDRRVDADRLGLGPARAEQAREWTGFAIGGIPPIGHREPMRTLVDSSLRRFETVWAAAGHPHAVFEITVDGLIAAVPDATVTET